MTKEFSLMFFSFQSIVKYLQDGLYCYFHTANHQLINQILGAPLMVDWFYSFATFKEYKWTGDCDGDSISGSLGALLLKIEGTSVCLDPVLYTWLLYQPSRRLVTSHISRDSLDRTEKSIPTEMRSPAKKASSQGESTWENDPGFWGEFFSQTTKLPDN